MASVWYIGDASARSISSEDWEQAGQVGRTASLWHPGNGYSLPQTNFTAAQLAILDADDAFTLTAIDGPRPGAIVAPGREVVTRGWVEERIAESVTDIVDLAVPPAVAAGFTSPPPALETAVAQYVTEDGPVKTALSATYATPASVTSKLDEITTDGSTRRIDVAKVLTPYQRTRTQVRSVRREQPTRFISANDITIATGAPVLTQVTTGNSYPLRWVMPNSTCSVTAVQLLPHTWGSVDVDILWTIEGTGTGNVAWQLQRSILGEGENLAAADTGTGVTTTVAPPATGIVKQTNIATAQPVSPGKPFRVEVFRAGGNALDTWTDTATILGIIVRPAARVVTTAGTTYVPPARNGQALRYETPLANYAPNKSAPLAIYFHGRGGTVDDHMTDAWVTALKNDGWMVAGAQMHDDHWGSPNAIQDLRELYASIQSYNPVSEVMFIGASMGAMGAWSGLRKADLPVIGAYMTMPVCDLQNRWDTGGIYPGQIKAAYGFTDDADFPAISAAYNPMTVPLSEFPDIRYRFSASPADTTVTDVAHAIPMQARLNGIATVENSYRATTGNHGDGSHFNSADILAFARRCLS